MQRAGRVIPKSEVGNQKAVDRITLERAARYRRRAAMTTDGGKAFLLDLQEATYLADGDALVLEDGSLVRVIAAAEPLLEIHADSPQELARIAWHIGNRHTPAEITPDAIYIQPDHVLESMVKGLGAHAHEVLRPFEPEGGAYGGKGPLHNGHHHHGHAHTHEPG